jgi:tetratricopeptide (TPR) repeat protein
VRNVLFCARVVVTLGLAATLAEALALPPVAAPLASARTLSAEENPLDQRPPVQIGGILRSLEHALAQQQRAQVSEDVQQLLAVRALGADVLLGVGVRLAQDEYYSEAEQVFARCVRDHPQVFEGHYDLALAQYALGRYQAGLTTLENTPPASPIAEVARKYLRGKLEESLGRDSEAERDLKAAVAASPQTENYALDLGLFYLRGRRYYQASTVFAEAAKFHPRSHFLLLGLSMALFREGRYPECLKACQELLSLDAGFSPAHLLMAFIYYLQGNLKQAETAAAQGMTSPHADPYLYYLHAAAQLKQRSSRYQEILQDLEVAEKGIPHCSLCFVAKSKVYERQGKVAAAISELQDAAQTSPSMSEAWYRLSILYQRAGDKKQAAAARSRFESLKSREFNREQEILRHAVMESVGSAMGSPDHSPAKPQ